MEQRYLDPRNDLVFKRIFGEHPAILRSFLNAVLPLEPDGMIESLEYLPAELVPQIPLLKYSIVDVRCRDQQGRQFIVEMQMAWTDAFMHRVLFNASKAYVKQLEKGEEYELLQPVIGLSLLDDVFDDESDEFYHHYRMVNVDCPQRVIEGLQLVFVELPKFDAAKVPDKMRRAWLRFLRETGDAKDSAAQAKLHADFTAAAPEVSEAMDLAGESAFNVGELEAYERYWDVIRVERTLMSGSFKDGKAEGRAEMEKELLDRLLGKGMSEPDARALLGL